MSDDPQPSEKRTITEASVAWWVWWFVTVALLSALLAARWGSLTNAAPAPMDLVLFLVLVGVWLLPGAKEVRLWGFHLKKDIAEVKREVEAVRNMIRINNAQHIHFGSPARPEVLEAIEKAVSGEGSEATLTVSPKAAAEVAPAETPVPTLDKAEPGASGKESLDRALGFVDKTMWNIPDWARVAFAVRYTLETELSRVYARFNLSGESPSNPMELLKRLEDARIVIGGTSNAIREILKICNRGTHGLAPSAVELAFVQEVSPTVLDRLRRLSGANET